HATDPAATARPPAPRKRGAGGLWPETGLARPLGPAGRPHFADVVLLGRGSGRDGGGERVGAEAADELTEQGRHRRAARRASVNDARERRVMTFLGHACSYRSMCSYAGSVRNSMNASFRA